MFRECVEKFRQINKGVLKNPAKFLFGYLLIPILVIVSMDRCFKCLFILSLYVCNALSDLVSFKIVEFLNC